MDDIRCNEILDQCCMRMKDSLIQMLIIWRDVGIDQENRHVRSERFGILINSFLNDMVNGERDMKQQMQNCVIKFRKTAEQLASELHMDDVQWPNEQNLTLMQLEMEFRQLIESLQEMRKHRLETLSQLTREESTLCEILREKRFELGSIEVPSVEFLRALEDRLIQLRELKSLREARIDELRVSLREMLPLLELSSADTGLGRDLVAGRPVQLSPDGLLAAEEVCNVLQRRVCSLRTEARSLRNNLYHLWNRLDIGETHQCEMLQLAKLPIDPETSAGALPSALRSLRKLVNRLEIEKSQNLERFVLAAREEIIDLWQRCYVDECERAGFQEFMMNKNFTEELLSLHEIEIERWKKVYSEHQTLFEGVAQWLLTWDNFILLEQKMKDPALLTNRGGIQLKLVKERAGIDRQLSRMERDIENSAEHWMLLKGKPFQMGGMIFTEYIAHKRATWEADKENEKLQRAERQRAQLKHEMQFGSQSNVSSNKRRFGQTTSIQNLVTQSSFAGSNTKVRKLNNIPTYNDSARTPISRRLESSNLRTPQSSSKVVTPRANVLPFCHRLLRSPQSTPRRMVETSQSHFVTPSSRAPRAINKDTPRYNDPQGGRRRSRSVPTVRTPQQKTRIPCRVPLAIHTVKSACTLHMAPLQETGSFIADESAPCFDNVLKLRASRRHTRRSSINALPSLSSVSDQNLDYQEFVHSVTKKDVNSRSSGTIDSGLCSSSMEQHAADYCVVE